MNNRGEVLEEGVWDMGEKVVEPEPKEEEKVVEPEQPVEEPAITKEDEKGEEAEPEKPKEDSEEKVETESSAEERIEDKAQGIKVDFKTKVEERVEDSSKISEDQADNKVADSGMEGVVDCTQEKTVTTEAEKNREGSKGPVAGITEE